MSADKKKKYFASLLSEAARVLKEQDDVAAPPSGAVSAVPPSPAPTPSIGPMSQTSETGPEGEKPFTVDEMIERLNVIRGGKSFSDPEVYGQLTTFFKGLSDQDKAVIDKFLQGLGKVVIQVKEQEGGPGKVAQPPMSPPQAGGVPAPAAPMAGGAPVAG